MLKLTVSKTLAYVAAATLTALACNSAYNFGRSMRTVASSAGEPGAISNQIYSELETKLFRQARKSTFKVIAFGPDGEQRWSGSAFLASINSKLVVVTAGHVCQGDDTEYSLDQEDDLFYTTVIAVSETTDTCFMSVSSRIETMRPYVIKNKPIIYGKQLAAIGHAFGGRLTQFLIKATGRDTVMVEGSLRTFITAMGAVYPGQSGGPVVDNVDGTAVALISATSRTQAFITPASDIISEFKKLVGERATNVTL